MKAEIVRKITKPTLICRCELWTITKRQKTSFTAIEIRFVRIIELRRKRD